MLVNNTVTVCVKEYFENIVNNSAFFLIILALLLTLTRDR
jgi:hypothetical protein